MADWIDRAGGPIDEMLQKCSMTGAEMAEIIRRHAPDPTRLEAERDRLRKALEFYADSGNWMPGRQACAGNDDSDVSNDHGKVAWAALKDATATEDACTKSE